MRMLLFIVGSLSLVLGVVGIFLPVLPTTPFLLLAAATFLRSSEKAHRWLVNHRYLGKYIQHYQSSKGIPRKAKFYSISTLWLTLGISIHFIIDPLIIRLLLVGIGMGVTIYLLSLPTYEPKE